MYVVVITGPESTGKTTLAKALAQRFGTVWVPEYARTYLDELGRPYGEEDLLQIATGQIALQDRYRPKAKNLLFCDTGLLVIKIWSDYRFGRCHPWIEAEIRNSPPDLYLLCGTDVPWEFDPMRENPNDRDELYQIYRSELVRLGLPFFELQGDQSQRLLKAEELLKSFLKK